MISGCEVVRLAWLWQAVGTTCSSLVDKDWIGNSAITLA